MSDPKAIEVRHDVAAMSEDELALMIRIAKDLAASQMFKGADPRTPITPHEAFAKILIGRDLGIGPTQALMTIDIVRGNIQMRAVLLASFVKRSPNYDYVVLEHDEQHCKIEFRERVSADLGHGYKASVSEFSMADADKAGLTKPTSKGEPSMYHKHPRNMLWARAMSNGVRWYCPDLTGGVPVYTEADTFEETSASELTDGHGTGESVGWQGIGVEQAVDLERILARAKEVGVAGLANRQAIEMIVNNQAPEFVAEWLATARDTLSEHRPKVTPEEAQAAADVILDLAEMPAVDRGALEERRGQVLDAIADAEAKVDKSGWVAGQSDPAAEPPEVEALAELREELADIERQLGSEQIEGQEKMEL